MRAASALALGAAGVARGQAAPLRVAVEPWPPWVEMSEGGGRPRGLAVELLDATLAQLGFSATLVPLPFPRALMLLEGGDIDVLPMLSFEADRMRFAAYSSPIVLEEILLCSAGRRIEWAEWSDLGAYAIAATRGYGYGGQRALLERHAGSLIDAHSDVASATMLAMKRVDLALLYRSTLPGLRREVGPALDGLRCAERPVLQMPLHFGISRRSPLAARLDAFDAAMAEAKRLPSIDTRLQAVQARF